MVSASREIRRSSPSWVSVRSSRVIPAPNVILLHHNRQEYHCQRWTILCHHHQKCLLLHRPERCSNEKAKWYHRHYWGNRTRHYQTFVCQYHRIRTCFLRRQRMPRRRLYIKTYVNTTCCEAANWYNSRNLCHYWFARNQLKYENVFIVHEKHFSHFDDNDR